MSKKYYAVNGDTLQHLAYRAVRSSVTLRNKIKKLQIGCLEKNIRDLFSCNRKLYGYCAGRMVPEFDARNLEFTKEEKQFLVEKYFTHKNVVINNRRIMKAIGLQEDTEYAMKQITNEMVKNISYKIFLKYGFLDYLNKEFVQNIL